MATVSLAGVSKHFADGTCAVDSLDLEVADGEFIVLVGPSGCGKTTSLMMVAGLETVSEGEIRIGDRLVNHLEPGDRDVAVVFQNYALYPHMSVYDNMAFGLKMRRVDKRTIQTRVEEIAHILDLEHLLSRKPRTLSGGQRQRVAMGRAIVRDPLVFLMDEPLSNLDAKLRTQMRSEIARIQHRLEATTIYVTHDQTEAMTMGDRIAVMRRGILQQSGAPHELYDAPANLFVASFIGAPPMNVMRGRLEEAGGTLICRFGDDVISVPTGVSASRPDLRRYVSRTIAVGVRPEDVQQSSDGAPEASGRLLRGTVKSLELLGAEVLVRVELAVPPVVTADIIDAATESESESAEERTSSAADLGRTEFIARLGRETTLQVDEPVALAVETQRLHFFDEETGRAL